MNARLFLLPFLVISQAYCEDLELKSFTYTYNGGGKTNNDGIIAKPSFSINQHSSCPTDYHIEGKTPECDWQLVLWLEKYAHDRKLNGQDLHMIYNVTYTYSDGTSRKQDIDTSEYLILFQIMRDLEKIDKK